MMRDFFEDILDWVAEHQQLVKSVVVGSVLSVLIVWGLYDKLADPPVVVGPSINEESRVVILLHGHGASKSDLEPLAEELAAHAPRVTFIMPQAPHAIGRGYTWYPGFRAPTKEAVAQRLLEYRAEARAVVVEFIEQARAEGVPDGEIYVGGFSQGATLALDIFLNEPGMDKLGGIMSLSGGALDLDIDELKETAPARTFVSHGTSDTVLGNGKSRAIVRTLEEGGHEVEFVEFDGGHMIDVSVREALGQFIAAP